MQSRANLSAHVFARLTAWALLWLVWLAGSMALWGAARARLDGVARMLASLLVIRATDHLPDAQKRTLRPGAVLGRHWHGRQGLWRAAIGSRLRRRLMRGTVGQRLTVLINLLHDFNRHVARLRRRLGRGLARRRVIAPRPVAPDAVVTARIARAPAACADTS